MLHRTTSDGPFAPSVRGAIMRLRFIGVVAAILMVASACSSTNTNETIAFGTGNETASSSTAADTDPADTDQVGTQEDDPSGTSSTTTSVEVVEAECLVGTWHLREQAFLDQIQTMTGESGITITHESGRYLMIFNADRTLVGIRENWAFRSEMDEGTIVTTISSTDPGSWSVAGDQLTIIDEGSEADVKFEFIVDGVSTPFPGGTNTVNSDGFSGTGPFSCVNNVLEFTGPEGVTATFDLLAP